MLTTIIRRPHAVVLTCLALLATEAMPAAQNNDKQAEAKRPKFVLRAAPPVGVAPFRVIFTGELQGGDDDFAEYYCPTVEWEWGDFTKSESTLDCEPYEAGKSQIKRRFTVDHTFRQQGSYKVFLRLKRKDKVLASTSTTIQVQMGPGGNQ